MKLIIGFIAYNIVLICANIIAIKFGIKSGITEGLDEYKSR